MMSVRAVTYVIGGFLFIAVPLVAGLLTVQTGQDKEITLPSKGVQKYRRYFVVFHATNILETQHVTIYSGKLDSQPDLPYDNRFRGRYRVTSYLSGRPLAFVLRNITEADAGVYSCQDDAVREIQGCENLLVVAKQPSRPVIPHPPATLSGSDVLLSCNSTSRSLPVGHPLNMSSVWRRNNISVDDVDGLKVEGLELRITYIQAGHNGDTFSCQTSEDGLTSEWSEDEQLHFCCGPNKILFNDAADTVLAVENTPIALRCSVECLPACSVTWNTTRWRPVTGLGEAVLFVQSVDRSMAGQYRCDVNNTYGVMSRKLKLTVKYTPVIITVLANSVPNVTIQEGSMLSFLCITESNPKPYVSLLRDGVITKNLSSELQNKHRRPEIFRFAHTIQRADISNSGAYVFKVLNVIGETVSDTVYVQVSPSNSVAIPVAVTTCTLAVVVAVATGISICMHRNRQVKTKMRYAAYLTTVGNRASLSSTDSHYATVDAGNLPQPRGDSRVTENDYQGLEEVERFHIYTVPYPPPHRGRKKCNIM
ncbi:myelin-associated glycoprotein-like [Haliotis cracherodii]|uniref:myelin-associated glycoprotein-like n=1 Tax=Haliotis cracherodii TaxID=6455 RepID=UPI0039EB4E67